MTVNELNGSGQAVDPMADVSETPDVGVLQEEYRRAWAQDPDGANRIARNEDVRYTRWAGQSEDGLKHQELLPEGDRALPYDRAPDCRVNLADQTIQDLVDTDYASFWQARVKTAPVSASKMSATAAAEWRQLISWMLHGPLRGTLIDDVEFASNVLWTVGWVVLHPCWRKKTQLRTKHLSLDAILQLAAQAPPESLLAQMPVLVEDPTMEDAAVEMLRMFFPSLAVPRARRVIKELRETGQAAFPAPDTVENVPELSVLVPWQDFIMPIEATADPMNARVLFRRMYLTEAGLKERGAEEEWSDAFVEAAVKTTGQALENGDTQTVQHAMDANNRLIEVVYAYSRGVDEDGVPGIYCTVFSPHVAEGPNTPAYGVHWLVDYAHGQYPFVILSTEVTGRRPGDARGVPDVAATAQLEMKKQRDATYVYSELSVTPPLQKRGSQASKLPPELGPLGIINNVAGEWSWFPPPPGEPKIAFMLSETVLKETQEYYGVPRPDGVPGRWQARKARKTMRWLSKWSEALWQLSVLAYQHLSPDELEGILGRRPMLSAEAVARHRLLLWFDVRALDPEWVEQLLKTISELVLPADSAGVVDRAKLIQFAMAYLDPTLADEVTTDISGARQAMFKDVRGEISSIMQGNEGLYVENDPTAKQKLAFAQNVIGTNPDYQLELDPRSPQFAPRKAALMQNWIKNLQQSAAQQDNKVIGRLGVKPAGM